jgi:hypothetical protein
MFEPPFCPNQICLNHLSAPADKWWTYFGVYDTKAFGVVPRFMCKACEKTFSVQTFSVHYWAKKVLDLEKLELLSASSMGTRSLSREFKCSCGTVSNRIDRIARQAIMVNSILRPEVDQREAVCYDDLVNFDRSQFTPNNVGISITAESRLILAISHAAVRRSGAMTEDQKKTRDRLDEVMTFEKKAVERSFREHLDLMERERSSDKKHPLIMITDQKEEYRRALHHHPLFEDQDEDHRCAHVTVHSKLPRTYWNPLFASNYIDREARKDQANFRRETTNQSQKAANCMSRLYSWAGYHNYKKKYLIKWPVDRTETHGEVAGIDKDRIASLRGNMFKARAFLTHLVLNALDWKVWMKAVYDPYCGKISYGYVPRFAYGLSRKTI